MIHFSLRCGQDHRFEAWFNDGASYDRQAAQGAVTCAVCGDTSISKAPMAPAVMSNRTSDKALAAQAAVMAMLRDARRQVEARCEYVGDRFAEEARKIHYGEADITGASADAADGDGDGEAPSDPADEATGDKTGRRGIYGEASPDEVEALADEGIEIGRVPWVPLEN
jgi:hypothetical protein